MTRQRLHSPQDFNIDLAQRVLDHVTKHPEGHNQSTVYDYDPGSGYCGTVACIAGWTNHFATKGRCINGMDAAEARLGLGEGEARRLFSAVISEKGARALLQEFINQARKAQGLEPEQAVKWWQLWR